MKTGLMISSLVISSLSAFPTWAEAPKRSVLVSVGQSQQTAKKVDDKLVGLGYADVNVDNDKHATAWRLGYRHPLKTRPAWSADIAYQHSGDASPAVSASPPNGKSNAETAREVAKALPKRGDGVSVTMVHHKTLTPKLTLQSGIGALAWESKRKAKVGADSYTAKTSGINPLIQLGLHYPISKKTAIEGQWQHTFMPDDDVDQVHLGLAVNF